MTQVLDVVKPGVVTGDDVQKLLQIAKDEGFALPAVNVVGTDSVNAVLEAAVLAKSPVIVQFSSGGAGFYAGKGCPAENAMVLGAVSGAQHVHAMAEAYGVPVVAPRVGDVAEIVTDGETGVLLTEVSPVSLAAAVQRVLDNPLLRKRARQAGPRLLNERYSIGASVDALLGLYRRTLRSK